MKVSTLYFQNRLFEDYQKNIRILDDDYVNLAQGMAARLFNLTLDWDPLYVYVMRKHL